MKKTRLRKKSQEQSAATVTPVPAEFQSRPLVKASDSSPIAANQAALPDLQRQQNQAGGLWNFGQLQVQSSTPTVIQPKLSIGRRNDKYEQQANQVAQQVVQRINAPAQAASTQEEATITKEEITNELKVLKSWDEVKKKYSKNESIMWKFFWYRKEYVDSAIENLRKKYPGLIAKSVGSQNISSDYDISLSSPGTDGDVKAIAEFNQQIKAQFGVQPGTLFDTNLYAKDFLKVEENLNKDLNNNHNKDTDLAQPGGEFEKLSNLDQDVAALIKQRRFMNQVEWDKYTQSVVSQIKNERKRQVVKKQYEEADAIYQIAAHELLEKSKKHITDAGIALTGQAKLGKAEEEELTKIKNTKVREMVKQQLLGMEELHLIAHEQSDLVLEESNKLYVDRMERVRAIQTTIQQLGNGDPEKVNALKAEVKQLLGQACFFASEAYHSEGAVKHVVAGLQGGKDNKKSALAKLTPENILQSYNEQLGDFLKDIMHYAKDAPGKMFYRSSKYLFRLFDAVLELRKRPEFQDIRLDFEKQYGTIKQVAQAVDKELLPIRGGKRNDLKTDQAKNNYAANFVKQTFGVTTGEGFKQIVLSMSVDFNQQVRNRLSVLMNPSTMKNYMNNIQMN